MKVTIKDRIAAHRSAPEVYDPPSFEQMADCIEELEANLAKATDTLVRIVRGDEDADNWAIWTLGELKGGKDKQRTGCHYPKHHGSMKNEI